MRQPILLFLRSNIRQLAMMLLASLLINLTMLSLPLFSMLVYDKAIGNKVHDTLWALAFGMMLMLILELMLRTARLYLVEHAGARWDAFLDGRLMRGILNTPLNRSILAADVISRVREVSVTRDILSAQSLLALADLPFLLIFAAVISIVGGDMILVPLLMGILIMLVNGGFQRAAISRQQEASQNIRQKTSLLVDVLAARESLFGRPSAQKAEALYRTESQLGSRATAKSRWWSQLSQQITPVLLSLSSVMLLVAGVFRVEAQSLSVGGLISVNMLSMRFLSILTGVSPLWGRWKEFHRALTKLGESVDLDIPLIPDEHIQASALASEGVRLESLSFRYPSQQQPVLESLSLQLRPGEFVALVGGSGSGKSTLLRILAGKLPHDSGQLTFGSHLVNDDASRQWMCRQVQHKPQDATFMGGSLRDVLSSGDDEISDEVLVRALRDAGLGGALDRGDFGLNTIIASNGRDLSGGQRQMVSIASVLHGGAPILLFDEPTLGLDRVAQEKVIDAIANKRDGRCVVVATHLAELIARADRMVVLDRGRVVADGSPQKLLSGQTNKAMA